MCPLKLDRRYATDAAPLVRGTDTYRSTIRITVLALLPTLALSVALFGPAAMGTILICVGGSLLGERIYRRLSGRTDPTSSRHAILLGLLLACMLPATVPWEAAFLVAVVTAAIGKGLLGGLGHYLWHPALIGRILLQLAYPMAGTTLGLDGQPLYPVLTKEHAIWGDLGAANPQPITNSWFLLDAGRYEAILRPNPVDQLRDLADGKYLGEPTGMIALIRDHLPGLGDTLFGAVGGDLGQTPVLAIILGGLFLIHRKVVSWQLPAVIVLSFALAIAVLPIHTPIGRTGVTQLEWFPGLVTGVGAPLPIGLLYVCYHLASGPLMLVAFFIATDWVASPMTVRGKVVYGALIGVTAAALRLYGVPPYDYWAVLIGNTAVPLIDRLTARRVLGT